MTLAKLSPSIGGSRGLTRGRHPTKITRNRAIAGLLKELAVALELDAFIAETGADPFHRRTPALGSVI